MVLIRIFFGQNRHALSEKMSGCRKHNTQYLIPGCLAALMLATSCSMIDEELPPCAPEPHVMTVVNFVYDYNMQFTDLFTDHVGSVYLYIFDENGVFLQRHSKLRADMGRVIDFSMTFSDKELEPGHTYQMVAVAQGNRSGYAASLETPGFQVIKPMTPGVSKIEDYILRLDRKHPDGTSGVGEFEFKDEFGNTQTMIDTLWSTKPDEVQIVPIPKLHYRPTVEQQPDSIVEVTIPMMRITNSIKVNICSGGFSNVTDPEDYTMIIHFPQGNGTIDFTGTVLPYEELRYRSLRKSLVTYTPGSAAEPGGVSPEEEPSARNQAPSAKHQVPSGGTRADENAQYAVQAEFGVSRLMMNDQSSLQISDAQTGEMLAEIPDFSKFLANAFDYYGDDGQEFLDREYNYEVTVSIDDKGITWIDLYLEVLGWYVRINNIDL